MKLTVLTASVILILCVFVTCAKGTPINTLQNDSGYTLVSKTTIDTTLTIYIIKDNHTGEEYIISQGFESVAMLKK